MTPDFAGSKPVAIGLIGYGRISQLFHLNILKSLPGTELVALAEAEERLREKAGAQVPGLSLFADYRDLIRNSPVEAVVICLPSGMHAEAALFALEHDKHVYLEKPLAISLEEAEKILVLQKEKDKIGMIGFNWRFHPVYIELKQALESGLLGNLISVRTVFSSPTRDLQRWKRSRQSGGGVLLDLASHHIDLLRFLFRTEVAEVVASAHSLHSEQDTAHLQLKLETGLVVQSLFSATSIDADTFEIFGENGKLTANRTLADPLVFTRPGLRNARFTGLMQRLNAIWRSPLLLGRFRMDPNRQSFHSALSRFVTCIRTQQPASPDFSDGFRSLEVVVRAEASLRPEDDPVKTTSA